MSNVALLRLRRKRRRGRSTAQPTPSDALARQARRVFHIAWMAPLVGILFPVCAGLSQVNSGFYVFSVPLGLMLVALPILLIIALSTGLQGLAELLRLLNESDADQATENRADLTGGE